MRIVSGSYFHYAGSKFRIYVGIGNYSHSSILKKAWNFQCFSYPSLIFFIFRIYCKCRISKFRFRPHCTYNKRAIFYVIKRICSFFIINFYVSIGCATNRTIINYIIVFIYKAVCVEFFKCFTYCV